MPLAAVIGRAELMDRPIEGGLGGRPMLAIRWHAPSRCRAGHVRIGRTASSCRGDRRAHRSARTQLGAGLSADGDIRRRGAMVGIELVKDRVTRQPAKPETQGIIASACRQGVILIEPARTATLYVPGAAHYHRRRARRGARDSGAVLHRRVFSARSELNRAVCAMWYYRKLRDDLVVMHTRPEHAPQLEELQRVCFPTLDDAERFKAAITGSTRAVPRRPVRRPRRRHRRRRDDDAQAGVRFEHVDHTFAESSRAAG